MLTITIPAAKLWDNRKEEFINTKECVLTLEHSLVSISKWESKWHKPFISDINKTVEETIDYVKHMTLTQNVDQVVYNALSKENFREISAYIDDKMTATWFNETKEPINAPKKKEVVTSELIYYWMISLEIPFECQKWHLNRLMTLIKVCNAKAKAANAKPTKNNKKSLASRAEINAARKKALGTSG